MNKDTKKEFIYNCLLGTKPFIFELPLYESLNLESRVNSKPEKEEFDPQGFAKLCHSYLSYNGTIDMYCLSCKKESVFTNHSRESNYFSRWYEDVYGLVEISYECTRDGCEQKYYSYFFKDKLFLVKVGQYPSVATFQIPQIEDYRDILGEDRYKEFTRGVGLAASGVGIGSYVYIRRVFDSLIKDAFENANSLGEVTQEQYDAAKYVVDKIGLLKKYLPKFLVENKSLYKILSKGIHELDEKTCLTYFPALELSIIRILKDKKRMIEDLDEEKIAKQAVQDITQEISA